MVINKENKVIVHILYPCYICANEYGGARQVINHVQTMHGYKLVSRSTGHHRPPNNHYEFENDVKKKWDVQHFGCPSCWFHCNKNFEELMEHMMNEHDPEKIEGFVQKNRDENEFESAEEHNDVEVQVQETDMTSDEEVDEAHGTATVDKGKEASHQKGVKDIAPQQGSSKKDDTNVTVRKENVDARAEHQTYQSEIAEEIFLKLGDLNDMFKNLFNKKE